MTNEELIKINEALIAKYGVAEATEILVKLVREISIVTRTGDANPVIVPHVVWGTDSNGNHIKGLGDGEVLTACNVAGNTK